MYITNRILYKTINWNQKWCKKRHVMPFPADKYSFSKKCFRTRFHLLERKIAMFMKQKKNKMIPRMSSLGSAPIKWAMIRVCSQPSLKARKSFKYSDTSANEDNSFRNHIR